MENVSQMFTHVVIKFPFVEIHWSVAILTQMHMPMVLYIHVTTYNEKAEPPIDVKTILESDR